MTPQDISSHIEKFRQRHKELETQLSDPGIYSNQSELKKVSTEHQRLSELFVNYERWEKALSELNDNRELISEEDDEEMRSLIESDISRLEKESVSLEKKVQLSLLPADPNENKNIIVEIRPAAGGDESALFAGDLYRMYSHFAERNGWKKELLDYSGSDLGGIKEVVFSLAGKNVFSKMKFESGVHRVQRIPTTESGGRIHTSTVTVAVMPEAEEVEIEIKPDELKFDVFRSSGPGGQSVNTTDSAVRVTHIPSGLSVASQQEKSQHRNKEIAMRILRARLLEQQQREEAAKQAANKRAQVGTGDRSERIRTYNYPQNRITDHRFGVSIHNLPGMMEGELELILNPIIEVNDERRLSELSDFEDTD